MGIPCMFYAFGFLSSNKIEGEKFDVALGMVQPSDISKAARNLPNRLEQFDFIPNISTPMEYVRFMVAE